MVSKVRLSDLESLVEGRASGRRSLFASDLADELTEVGELEFSVRYRTPMLVVMGFAGELKGENAHNDTMVVLAPTDQRWSSSSMTGRVFPIRKLQSQDLAPIAIGRVMGNDVVIPEYSISKRHCLIRLSPFRVTIEDAGSTNGTAVDDVAIKPNQQVVLRDNAHLTLGRFRFRFMTAPSFLQFIKKSARSL